MVNFSDSLLYRKRSTAAKNSPFQNIHVFPLYLLQNKSKVKVYLSGPTLVLPLIKEYPEVCNDSREGNHYELLHIFTTYYLVSVNYLASNFLPPCHHSHYYCTSSNNFLETPMKQDTTQYDGRCVCVFVCNRDGVIMA